MSKTPQGYHSKEKEGDNASKGGKGRSPPVDGPPVDGPPVDGPPVDGTSVDDPPVEDPPVDDPSVDDPSVDDPPVDGTQADTTQTESSLSTGTVQPSGDPTGSSGDLANDIVPADNMPIHSHQEPGQSLHDGGVKGSGSTVQGASAGGNMSGNGTRPKTSEQVPSTINKDLVCDRRDMETRQSFHDIGICVRAFDDKVRGLLRKVAACRILKSSNAQDWRNSTTTQWASFNQWSTLTDQTFTHKKALDTIKQEVLQKADWYRNTLFSAFGGMIHRFYGSKDSQNFSEQLTGLVLKVCQSCEERPMIKGLQNFATLTDEIFQFLQQESDNGVVYDSLIKVLIEHFLRDMNYSILELNDILAKNDKKWKPHEDISCPDMDDKQKPKHKKCSSDRCSIRYTRDNGLNGKWDWVDEMRYIRNNVVKGFFRFKDEGQKNQFIDRYKWFIEDVDFTEIFPLAADDKRKEYMVFIESHDGAERRRLEQDKREEEEERKHLDYLDLAV